jgi:chloramphenicol 3-O phosphotransferase
MEFQIMKIIYLNGTSSSGKTTLSKRLQESLPDNYLHIGIDTLISMMPQKTNNFCSLSEKEGFYYKEVLLPNNEMGKRIVSGTYGKQVNTAFHQVVNSLLATGHNLIIDDVADGESEISIWEQELQAHSLTKIAVMCSLPELIKREKSRTERMQGSAMEQYYRVHENVIYDFTVYTDKYSTIECAQQIVDHITEKHI